MPVSGEIHRLKKQGLSAGFFAGDELACVAGVQRGGRGEVECEREARRAREARREHRARREREARSLGARRGHLQ